MVAVAPALPRANYCSLHFPRQADLRRAQGVSIRGHDGRIHETGLAATRSDMKEGILIDPGSAIRRRLGRVGASAREIYKRLAYCSTYAACRTETFEGGGLRRKRGRRRNADCYVRKADILLS